MCLYEVIMTLHFLNDVVDTKTENYVTIASLKSKPTCKLISRVPGLRPLISSLLGWDLRRHVESLGKPQDSTSVLEALPGKTRFLKTLTYLVRNENHYLSLLSFGTVVTGKHLYYVTLNTWFTYASISQPEVYFPYIRLPLKINNYLI